MRIRSLVLLGTLPLVTACAPDLRLDYPFDGELPSGSYIQSEPVAGGYTLTRVDATHREAWVYMDLDGDRELPAAEAMAGSEWDLAFQRFKIISDGGISGPGQVEVAVLPGVELDAVTEAPASGYLRDAPDGADGNQDIDSAFLLGDGWYEYSLTEHRLKARNAVYVVRTPSAFYKLRMESYYDEAGTGGKLSFRWAAIPGPVGP